MRHVHTAALVIGILIGLAAPARAQDRSDFASLQATLKAKDQLTLTTVGGGKVKGRMVEVSADRIVLQLKDGPRTVEAPQIEKVQKRKNGVLLGAVIGAVAALPFALALSSYAYNEGADRTIALFPIIAGVGGGIAIDAALSSNKTLYERKTGRIVIAPMVDAKGGFGGRLAFKF